MYSPLTYRNIVSKLGHPAITVDSVSTALSILSSCDGYERSIDDFCDPLDLSFILLFYLDDNLAGAEL